MQPKSFKSNLITILVVLNLVTHFGRAILVNEPTNSSNVVATTTSQPTVSITTTTTTASGDRVKAKELDKESAFYYDAEAFLVNKSQEAGEVSTKSSSNATAKNEETGAQAGSRTMPPPASIATTSGRSGRMLDLDALVGDLALSRTNKERSQSGNRQSRFLPGMQPNLELGPGKKLHIQGFIPIVGIKDANPEDEQEQEQLQQAASLLKQQRGNLLTSSNHHELPYAQSSPGHATFGVQRYLQTEPAQQQLQPQYAQLDVGAQQVELRPSGLGSSVIESMKRPVRKLASLGIGGGNSQSDERMLQQQQQQQPNCLCVPFYMCKNGFISESGLGRAQIQQMILKQQQPRQGAAHLGDPLKRGSVDSVPIGGSQQLAAQYANSYVSVDERSNEREIITMAPPVVAADSQLQVAFNESIAELMNEAVMASQQLGQQEANDNSSNRTASAAADEARLNGTVDLGQGNDYSQEILGRMLGLKTNSKMATGGPAAPGGGVCGILRTCCSIPIHILPSQQDMASERLMGQYSGPNNVQRQSQASAGLQQAQFALQRFQKQQVPYGLPAQTARLQMHPMGGFEHQQQSYAPLAHRTSNQYTSLQSRYQAPQVVQYTRAVSPMQPLQSFQQQQQQPQQQPNSLAAPMQTAASMVRNQQVLGTKKILDGRCGLRQSAGITGRVQNLAYHESSADFGEYPAQAAILKRLNGNESLFVCGGTLISQYWVATAAHCIKKHAQSNLKVRLGEWDVHRDDEFYPYVEKEVRDLVVHPEFVSGNLINDIALLRLDSPVDPSLPHVNPACLPTSDELFTRQRCWVTGWGKDSFGQKGSFQAVLREVELPVVSQTECESALRQTRLGQHYRLHPGFVCAGGEGGRDACEGDGGSGLYCFHEGLIKVAGLVSWGIGCGQAGVPGVYVSMAHYRSWIENIISIDEDIYSSYNNLVGNTLISERSNGANSTSLGSETPAVTLTTTVAATGS